MFWAMDNKTWLLEVEVAVCLAAVAIVALALMLGSTLWKSLTGK
jgi:hypothetical protein